MGSNWVASWVYGLLIGAFHIIWFSHSLEIVYLLSSQINYSFQKLVGKESLVKYCPGALVKHTQYGILQFPKHLHGTSRISAFD